MGVTGINHITWSVADVEAEVAFLVDVLGCVVVAGWPKGAYLLAGDTWLAVTEGADDVRGDSDYSHIAFAIGADDVAAVRSRLAASGAKTWQDNWTEGDSIYFTDPAGHRLEVHVTDLVQRLRIASVDPWPGLEITDAGRDLLDRASG